MSLRVSLFFIPNAPDAVFTLYVFHHRIACKNLDRENGQRNKNLNNKLYYRGGFYTN